MFLPLFIPMTYQLFMVSPQATSFFHDLFRFTRNEEKKEIILDRNEQDQKINGQGKRGVKNKLVLERGATAPQVEQLILSFLGFFARLLFYISLIFKFFISHSNHSLKSCLKPLIEYCSCSSASLSF